MAGDRAAAVDWAAVAASLDAVGYGTTPALLTGAECRRLAALYANDEPFRRRIVMQQRAYGSGEYEYFRYPLPEPVDTLRQALYPRLAPIANRWRERLREAGRFPPELGAYLAECHAAGQLRPTPLMLKYGTGDYNRLHQDLYGALVFPLQATVLLSGRRRLYRRRVPAGRAAPARAVDGRGRAARPGRRRDLPGQPPSGRRRPGLPPGDDAARRQPLRRGQRFTLGIIFHDAA